VLHFPTAALFPFLAFFLVLLGMGKLFRALALNGHFLIMGFAVIMLLGIIARFVGEGQYILAVPFLLCLALSATKRTAGLY